MKDENLPILAANSGEPVHIAHEIDSMPDVEEESSPSGMSLHDILFMLFRHKWKIIFLALAGLLAAGAVYFSAPPVYESEAKLLVRYVMERSAVDGLDSQIKTPSPENHTLINSELEILTSSDLIRQVAEAVGINRLAAGPPSEATTYKAIEAIDHNLDVAVVKDTNIISVGFRSGDPSLPMPLVQELVKRYFDKHLQVHRSTGAFNFVRQETADLKKQLVETEAELKQVKGNARVISLVEAKKDVAAELAKTQDELDTAVAEQAAQQARLQDLEKSLALPDAQRTETPAKPISGDILERYKSLVARLVQLQKAETDLLLKYTQESPIVKVKATQIAELEKQRGALEKEYPALVGTASAESQNGQTASPNIAAERAILAGLDSKVTALKTRMGTLEARVQAISQVAPQIQELERKAEVEETNYKASEASLEKAQIDETLDPSRMPNISIVQNPSPATAVKRNVAKAVMGLAGGGVALGVGLALLIEMMVDQTVKRSLELERRLRIPLLLSIPYLSPVDRRLRLRDIGSDSEGMVNEHKSNIAIANGNDAFLRPFCEAIRDRLGLYFQANNMSYKPKLVAVTGLAKNAGASSIAAGLADALSEVSEGKVLLVDKVMSPKGFYNALTEFKRSDLDYVVFDMPSLGDTSATLPLAGFMDTVLLVVEAGKSNRQAVKRAYAQLAAKTKVSVVFNKSRSYGPKWLEGDF